MNDDDQEFSYTAPTPQDARVVNFNPIFPILTAEVELDLPTTLINKDVIKLAGDQKNYEGGYTTLFNRPEVDKITHMSGLRQAIYGIVMKYVEEVGFNVNAEKCSIDIWANLMRKGGYHPPHNHPRCHFSGTYYSLVEDGASPLILMNPTSPYRMHEAEVSKDVKNPFTAEGMVINPKQGSLYMWPSWLYHYVPEMSSDKPRISFSFNVDFLPPGA